MQYSIISHTSACENTVRRFFLSLHLIKSQKLNETNFCITSVLQQNNISLIFSIENILFA